MNLQRLYIIFYLHILSGIQHLTREQLVSNHTRHFAQKLFDTNEELILIADATYIYIEKSSNYKFQRSTYSMHKNRPLLKPMVLVTTTGYIIDIMGPYFANGSNNDSGILKDIIVNI